ncbi:MAG: M48 family metallopeptidase [Brevundimonas sp.]|uniref:M48 family metallopeptidase n=1 Tax=Brevundimonas sp. TaxID=1871086 RepID=UPI002723A165|nr:M48 family metallopeptidase [Brevundimonas sp.]MDO9588106.1 M48 family metallopeptidase [Brevundimonas sp.]MDP3655473.1 M48 family metallopeptidase [Brevundimonas sp.]MDZ4111281.1 M48 family metallopeptidase [Brevundimonas sp.]
MIRPLTLAALAATALLGACAYNETLGRNQLLIIDDSALTQQADAAWAETLRTQRVSSDAAANARIRRVGDRIVQAAGLSDRRWDYALFVSESPNAFVLPSGKIGVTTGLLALVRNDDQLATVLGHEVGHVVARHAAERYSTTAITGTVLRAGQSLAGDQARAAGAIGGLGAQLGFLLPFSRNHELEADRLGVDYLQRAGFRTSEAVALWRLMAAQRQGSTPEFASTHPSDANRIAALEQYIASKGWS